MPPKRKLPGKSHKKPFSHKQKKQQLLEKRHKKRERGRDESSPAAQCSDDREKRWEEEREVGGSATDTGSEGEAPAGKLSLQPAEEGAATATTASLVHGRYNPDRYKLLFKRENPEEIARRKIKAQTEPIIRVPESSLEVSVEDVYCPGSELDIPKRPAWSYDMSKEEVEEGEESMFQEYLSQIHSYHRTEDISHFEHNLETWRQLWRVLEISDIILLITDIRHPALHFSPALYSYVVDDLKKKMVLILNKIDLVPSPVVVAWRHYFLSHFPQLTVICFTCDPNHHPTPTTDCLQPRRRVRGTLPSAVGPSDLLRALQEMYPQREVNFTDWQQKLVGGGGRGGGREGEEVVDGAASRDREAVPREAAAAALDHREMITIGMVGHPNVGKSSILNGLMGKKVVSTSRTPGHTKHFQTIFLTPSIRLCDCPGLVFPSLVEKQLQILSGLYPVAQVQEPYTVVGYLAQRVPLPVILGLRNASSEGGLKGPEKETEEGEKEAVWTAWDICDAWAVKRRFYTSRAARTDVYRAANNILRLAVEGRICMSFRPPGYHKERTCWEDHKDVCEINAFQKTTSAMSIPTRNHGNVGDLSDPEEGLSGVDEGQGSSDDGEG